MKTTIKYNNPSWFSASSDRISKVNVILADAGIRIDSLLVFGSVLERSIETVYSHCSALIVPDNIFDQFIADLSRVEAAYVARHDGKISADLSGDASSLIIRACSKSEISTIASFDFLGIQLIRATSVNKAMTEP